MASKLKSVLVKLTPNVLIKPVVSIARKSRIIRFKADMVFHPRAMNWFCPCCGMRFRNFIAGDYAEHPDRFNQARYAHTRQDVICPVCKALPRHRIFSLWCENHKEQLKSADILYFAQEYSETVWMKRNGIACTTADLYMEDADLIIDIQDIQLQDESFDLVICNHVLEHVDDFRLALKEVYRVLRPGGMFICSFPIDPTVEFLDEEETSLSDEERLIRFGQNDHKRVFGIKADQFLTDAGFVVEVINGEDYPNEILPVIGPADYDMNRLFCCTKKL